MPVTYLVLHDDGTFSEITKPDGLAQVLRVLQSVVGGYVEGFGLPSDHPVAPGHMLYLNEDGKSLGLRTNANATHLAFTTLGPDDTICGNAVLVGPADEDGESTSVTPAVAAAVRALVRA